MSMCQIVGTFTQYRSIREKDDDWMQKCNWTGFAILFTSFNEIYISKNLPLIKGLKIEGIIEPFSQWKNRRNTPRYREKTKKNSHPMGRWSILTFLDNSFTGATVKYAYKNAIIFRCSKRLAREANKSIQTKVKKNIGIDNVNWSDELNRCKFISAFSPFLLPQSPLFYIILMHMDKNIPHTRTRKQTQSKR